MHREDYIRELKKLGINVGIGIGYCGDVDLYMEILNVSCNAAVDKIRNLKNAYEQENYEQYKILVHSVKSSAANMGAKDLSEMAKFLENAGIKGDYEYIKQNHFRFMECYEKLMNKLRCLLHINNMSNCMVSVEADTTATKGVAICNDGLERQTNNKEIMNCGQIKQELTEGLLDELFQRIMVHLRELELDEAEGVVKVLLSYKLHEEKRHQAEKLLTCLQNFDVEGAKEIVCQLNL